jgi:hypothetical protein
MDRKAIKEYGTEVWAQQLSARARGVDFELPPSSPFLDPKTRGILKVYRNMARVFHNSGQPVPDPIAHLKILERMAETGITFASKKKGQISLAL